MGAVIDEVQQRTLVDATVHIPSLYDPMGNKPLTIASGIKVYPGDVAGAEVIVDIVRIDKVRPVDGGGTTTARLAAAALTREDAASLAKGILRSLGILDDVERALQTGIDSLEAMVAAGDGLADAEDEATLARWQELPL